MWLSFWIYNIYILLKRVRLVFMLALQFASVKIYVPCFQFLMLSIHCIHHYFVRSTHCSSIHAMNGSWLQDLAMQLLSYLTCENYPEACMLPKECVFSSLLPVWVSQSFSFIMLQFSVFYWSVNLPAILNCYAVKHLILCAALHL
jgi:hypothetical protein